MEMKMATAMNMDLNIEALDVMEAPLSDAFWGGFAIGLGIVGTVAAGIAIGVTLT